MTGPSGRITQLVSDLSQKGASVSIFVDGVKSATMSIKGADVTTMEGDAETRTLIHSDGSVTVISPWSTTSELETVPYGLLAEQDSMMGETFPVPAKMKTSVNGITTQRVEWRYYLRRDNKAGKKLITQVGRKLRVSLRQLFFIPCSVSFFLCTADCFPFQIATFDAVDLPLSSLNL